VEEVNALAVKARGGIELEHVVFPGGELLKGVVSEGQIEGVLDLVVHLLAQGPQVVLDAVSLLVLVCLHIQYYTKISHAMLVRDGKTAP
jgi:hypothetical protein